MLAVTDFITSADEIGEVMFSVAFVCLFVCLSVCLSVCPDDNSKTVIAIDMKFSGFHVTVPE